MVYDFELEFAIKTARAAGKLLFDNHGRQNDPQWATPTNFKIDMDKKSDSLIRQQIRAQFPDDDIYSEEAEDIDRGRARKWVFDPLDGTLPYTMHQNNNWAVAIALIEDRTPVLGVVYMPERSELYYGLIGGGAYCNGKKIKVSEQTNINKVLMGLDDGKEVENWFARDSLTPFFAKLNTKNGISCFFRSACASVPLCQTASGSPSAELPLAGRLDAYIGGALEPFDMVAEVPIIREAGGKVTHLSGKEWEFSRLYKGDPTILAANPALHETLRKHLETEIAQYYEKNNGFKPLSR